MAKVVVLAFRDSFKDAKEKMKLEVGKEFLLKQTKYLTGYEDFIFRRPGGGFIDFGLTPASIAVVDKNGKFLVCMRQGIGTIPREDTIEEMGDPRILPSLQMSAVYTDFLLTSLRTQQAEKQQIIETFGDAYVFFYGKSYARLLSCSGILINTIDYPWLDEWIWNFNNALRGSVLRAAHARAYLTVGTTVYEGYFMNYDISRQPDNDLIVPFNFTFFITDEISVAADCFDNWEVLLKEELTESEQLSEESLSTKIGKKIAKRLIAETWSLIKDPTRLKALARNPAGMTASIAKSVAWYLGLDIYDEVGKENIGPVKVGTLAGTITLNAGKVIGTSTATQSYMIGTNLIADVLNGMTTTQSGFDSNSASIVSDIVPKATLTSTGKEEGTPVLGQSDVLPKEW